MGFNNFKPGDKIVRMMDSHYDVQVGKVYTFHSYYGENEIKIIEDMSQCYAAFKFKLVKRIKEPVTNDIEWLDRVQENFKE
jgi:hypothetical protein